MKTPMIILFTWWAISLLYAAHLHGRPMEGDYNFFNVLTRFAITVWLLWWAGLLDNL